MYIYTSLCIYIYIHTLHLRRDPDSLIVRDTALDQAIRYTGQHLVYRHPKGEAVACNHSPCAYGCTRQLKKPTLSMMSSLYHQHKSWLPLSPPHRQIPGKGKPTTSTMGRPTPSTQVLISSTRKLNHRKQTGNH